MGRHGGASREQRVPAGVDGSSRPWRSGHGESGEAPWSWREVLDDVAAVAGEYGLHRPVVVGHSLGGMVATLWAGEHPECPLTVNLDGHGNPTRPGQFFGMDDVSAARACREMTAFLERMGQGLPEFFLQVMRETDALDLFAAYRAARCPVLVVSGDAAAFAGVFPDRLVPAWNAYCAWVRRQLEEVTRESRLVTGSVPADGTRSASRKP
ncbi:alpha/beta hydrolase [Nonomuraea sp. NPDC050691]|uniref:alpha/beta fold hydrolase n=1 Tax=Nonomuraea sp. NPDC050691 TaxID=3155661 RepID=UPI0033E9885F